MRIYFLALHLVLSLLMVLGGSPLSAGTRVEPASVENMAYPLPDEPSFAITLLDNVNSDPEIEYLREGMTVWMTDSLARIPGLFVIAPGSTFTYRNKPVAIKTVAEELGVRYIVDGGIEMSDGKLLVSARLTDALKGELMWSGSYDRSIKDIFSIQDDIVFNCAKAAGVKGQTNVSTPLLTRNVDAYLVMLKAEQHLRMPGKEGPPRAKPLLEEAIAIDQNFSVPYAFLSMLRTNMARGFFRSEDSREANFKSGLALAQKAVEINNTNDFAYVALGYNMMCQKKPDIALKNFDIARKINPLNDWAYSEAATCLSWEDREKEAVIFFEEAIRLNPKLALNYLRVGRIYYHLRQYEDAVRMHQKCYDLVREGHGAKWWPHLHLAMVYSEMGREAEARSHMRELIEVWPKFNLEDRSRSLHFKDPALVERELTALRKAGAPEHPPAK
jgi:adenylate cyclase